MRKIKTESGRSLVETLSVLVVMAILLLASLAGYHFLIHQYKKQQTVKQISELAVRYKVRPVHADDEKVAIKTIYPEADRSDAYTVRTADEGRVSLNVQNTEAFSVVVSSILDDSCEAMLKKGEYDAVLATNNYEPKKDYIAIGRKWLQDLDADTLTSEQKDALRDFLGSGVAITRENIINKICAGPTIGTAGLVFGDRCPKTGFSYWYSGKCWSCPKGQKEDKDGNCCSTPNDCNVCQDSGKQNNCFQGSNNCYSEGSGKTFCDAQGSRQCVECVNDSNCACRDGHQYCSQNHCCPVGQEWNGLACACPEGQEMCGTQCCSENFCVTNATDDTKTCCTNTGANTTKCGNNSNCCESGNCSNGYCCPAGEEYADGNGQCCSADKLYEKEGAKWCCNTTVSGNFCPDTCGTGCSVNGVCFPLNQEVGTCGVCTNTGVVRKSGIDAACCDETTWEMKTFFSEAVDNCGRCNTDGRVEKMTEKETVCKVCSGAPNWLLGLLYTDGRQYVVTHAGEKTCCKKNGAKGTECDADKCCSDTMTCVSKVSGKGHCCPAETPVWDATTNTCIDCLADTDCAGNQVCKADKTCGCPDGKTPYTRSDNGEIACCHNETQSLDDTKGMCCNKPLVPYSVKNGTEVQRGCCPAKKPIWDGENCVECMTDTDCAGNQVCKADKTCGCPANNPYYSTTLKKCVTCLVDYGRGTGACPTTANPLCRATADKKNQVCNQCPADKPIYDRLLQRCSYKPGTVVHETTYSGTTPYCYSRTSSCSSGSSQVMLLPGYYKIIVIGAGGGSAALNHNTSHNGACGATGGAGGIYEGIIHITSEKSYKVYAGDRGVGGERQKASNGGSSYIQGIVTCTGGTGGEACSHRGTPIGGSGGSCRVQNSGLIYSTTKNVIGGSGGTMHYHGGSGRTKYLSGAGSEYGSSCGFNVGWTSFGSDGACGYVKITYLGTSAP